ncbi:hypothetical protein BJ170DRAFT_326844 [Xylariales sp. AK1849]|nr:hypothetical protein BJ170DRAFT_326844 [Xylariales sp. AK1849]
MASQVPKVRRFVEAMKRVYGPFDEIPQEDLATWTAPPQPGNAGHKGRYLWTDAFGVVNFVTLYSETQKTRYLDLAKGLVKSVHDVLGRTRDGGSRLPGATDEEPLKGGLRIGKLEDSEPDCDGQYHHYLTLWMYALNRLSIAAKEAVYNDLAIQLAKAIHPRFLVDSHGGQSMVWKISMDMSQPLTGTKGHLDNATGSAIFQLLQSTAKHFSQEDVILEAEIDQYRGMMARDGPLHAATDMLDLGMSLWISHLDADAAWSYELSRDALHIARRTFLQEEIGPLSRSIHQRLAFRDFGACLGAKCYDDDFLTSSADLVVEEWEKVMYKSTPQDLMAITLVMYAGALIPGAFRTGYPDKE